MFERLLPRHLNIIYEINSHFLRKVATHYPGDFNRLERMSIVQEQPEKAIRMANLSVVGSSSTNGVAALHTRLLMAGTMSDFADFYPERFNNKTNGVTPRRWLLKANPKLAALITEKIGDGWITDLDQLRGLEKFAGDKKFRERVRAIKRENKVVLADFIQRKLNVTVSPDSMFDVQVKRIHEYKRQLLLALYIIVLFNRLKANPSLDIVPRTFIIGGKAAPAYHMAKLIIKLINQIGQRRQLRSGSQRQAQGHFHSRLSGFAGRKDHAGGGLERADLHGRDGGVGYGQHEVRDERRADHRNPGWRQHRDQGGGRRREHLHFRPDRRAGGIAPRQLQSRRDLHDR